MLYLVIQISLSIAIAVLFGIFIGWLFWGKRQVDEAEDAIGLKPEDDERDETIALLRGNLSKCKRELNDIREGDRLLQKKKPQVFAPTTCPESGPVDQDDLKEIKGVGPFLEKKLNGYGIRTFKQVAELGPVSIRNLGDTFGAFEKRIIWERWVEQAEELMKKYQTR